MKDSASFGSRSSIASKGVPDYGGLSTDDYAAALAVTPGYGGRDNGMGVFKTSYFLIATMIGAGFLALPRALADAGWLGIPMILIFGGSVGFAATRLGKSWVILEERWPQYRLPARQPYMDLAEKAFGQIGRKICFACVISTLIGYGIAFIVLIADMMDAIVPQLSMCIWIVIITLIVWPATFFGTPKDFWQASVLAVCATAVTITVILVQLIIDVPLHPMPQYPNPDVIHFSLGFSGILFAFGGVSVFPTLQNDMQNRREWWKSITIGFSVVLSLYMPIAIAGYVIIGNAVSSNILLDTSSGVPVTVAIVLNIVNLLCTFVICFNPVGQAFEDIFGVENKLSFKRILLRSAIILFEFVVSLALPDFGAILNLIGGTTIAILSFIFPPLMYLRFVDMKGDWKPIEIPLWERIYLWMIVVVAVVGGITSTISAIIVILDPDAIGESCFANFDLSHNTS